MRSLDPRTRRVPRPELLRPLLAAGRLQRLVLLTGQQRDDPRLLLRLRAPRPRRTRRAVLPREPRLEGHAVLRVRVREPGDALLARRASHHPTVPVHREAPLVEARAGARLPPGVRGHRADDRHPVTRTPWVCPFERSRVDRDTRTRPTRRGARPAAPLEEKGGPISAS